MQDGAIATKLLRDIAIILMKFLTHRVSLQSSHLDFPKIFVSPKMAAILNIQIFFAKFAKHKNAYNLENCARKSDCDEIFDPQGISAN